MECWASSRSTSSKGRCLIMDNLNQDYNPKKNGLAALTTIPKIQTRKINLTDNSTYNQCLKLLDYLLERGSITTSEAREKLDIMSPAPRILELREAGYQIDTVWDNWTSEYGIKHRIGRYVLTHKQPLEPIKYSEVA